MLTADRKIILCIPDANIKYAAVMQIQMMPFSRNGSSNSEIRFKFTPMLAKNSSTNFQPNYSGWMNTATPAQLFFSNRSNIEKIYVKLTTASSIKVTSAYYWPNIYQDIEEHVQTYLTSRQRKKLPRNLHLWHRSP